MTETRSWTAKRKSALVIEIIQGKTTVSEASRSFDLSPSEIEGWVEDAKRGLENSLRANPLDIHAQYEKQLKDLQEAYGEAMLELRAPIAKLCAWFGVPRRTVYYRPTKSAPKVDPRFAEPIKAMIEKEPSFGYRTVAWLLGFNKNTVQRIVQIKGWQVRKRAVGMRPRIEAVPSVATAPNERLLSAFASQLPAGQWVDRLGTCLDRKRWLGIVGIGDRLPYP
ncbi:transposase [Cohaesibacter sp. ES.047]|uniref:transposase n=1 Tax=Cohaesibacter sp. ES.047 TaxID=1798205 RepID=UPI00211099D2|nr:transposase [Cohaesibacter sp. ES.047]